MKPKLKPTRLNNRDYPVLLNALRYDIEENGLTKDKQAALDKLRHFVDEEK